MVLRTITKWRRRTTRHAVNSCGGSGSERYGSRIKTCGRTSKACLPPSAANLPPDHPGASRHPSSSRRGRLGGLDLRAVHEAPRGRVEGVAAVQGAAVVPDQHVARLPLLAEDEFQLRRMRP